MSWTLGNQIDLTFEAPNGFLFVNQTISTFDHENNVLHLTVDFWVIPLWYRLQHVLCWRFYCANGLWRVCGHVDSLLCFGFKVCHNEIGICLINFYWCSSEVLPTKLRPKTVAIVNRFFAKWFSGINCRWIYSLRGVYKSRNSMCIDVLMYWCALWCSLAWFSICI